jgi:hypothetical protein
MPTPQGLPSLEEALGAAAIAESFVEPDDDIFGVEGAEDAESAPAEQAQQEDKAPEVEEPSPFADLMKADEAQSPGQIDWNAKTSLPGFDGEVPLSEMRDGYLRQADYTRKTQRLAEDRKAFEAERGAAAKLMQALEADPAGTAAALAVRMGLVTEADIEGKVRQARIDWQPPPSRAEVEAQVEQRVAQEVAKHPAVLEAQAAALGRKVDGEFARIEGKFGIKLGPQDRLAILKRASDAGATDLELVTEGMLRRIEQSRQARDTASAAAPSRPSVRAPSTDAPARKAKSVEEAMNMAIEEIRGQAAST